MMTLIQIKPTATRTMTHKKRMK